VSVPVRVVLVHKPGPNDYVESCRAAGVEPVVVHWDGSAAAALDGASALLLSGGADINPQLYGEAPHPTYQRAEGGRDGFEVEVIRLALERDLPTLAICRGMQVLNVVCGGSLWQDLPSQRPSGVAHRVPSPRDDRTHVVELAPGSHVRTLLAPASPGADPAVIDVNSRHHQAVKHTAPGFLVTATAPDGVVEAIERPASRFCVGVQWHPENFWRTGEFLPLFRALLEHGEQ
jgi:putative glutamine amidotransferase